MRADFQLKPDWMANDFLLTKVFCCIKLRTDRSIQIKYSLSIFHRDYKLDIIYHSSFNAMSYSEPPADRMRKKSQITQKFESILRGRIGQLCGKNSKLRGNLNNYKIVSK